MEGQQLIQVKFGIKMEFLLRIKMEWNVRL
jgi:hypothetical protein